MTGNGVAMSTSIGGEIPHPTEFSLEVCDYIGVGVIWEELLAISKLLYSTYLKIKGICLLKALTFKRLKYTGENTALDIHIIWSAPFPHPNKFTIL